MEWWIIIPVAIFLHFVIGWTIARTFAGSVFVDSYGSFAFVIFFWEICLIAAILFGMLLAAYIAMQGMQYVFSLIGKYLSKLSRVDFDS